MALADKDRIFTNVYGFQPWNVDAAIARSGGLESLQQSSGFDAGTVRELLAES